MTRAESLPDYIGALKETEVRVSAAAAGGRRDIHREDRCPTKVTRCETLTDTVAVHSRRSSPANAAAAYKGGGCGDGGGLLRHNSLLLSASRTRKLSPTAATASGTDVAVASSTESGAEISKRNWTKSGGLFTSAFNLLTRRRKKSESLATASDDAEKLLSETTASRATNGSAEKNPPRQVLAERDRPTNSNNVAYRRSPNVETLRTGGSKLHRSASERRSDRRVVGFSDGNGGSSNKKTGFKPLRPGDRNSGRSSSSLSEQKLLSARNNVATTAANLHVTSDVRKSTSGSVGICEKSVPGSDNLLNTDRSRLSAPTTAVFNVELNGDFYQSAANDSHYKKRLEMDGRLTTAITEVITVSDNVSLGSSDDVSSTDSFVTAFEQLLLDIDIENNEINRHTDSGNKIQSTAGDRRRKFANSRSSSNVGDYQLTTNSNEKTGNVRRKLPRGNNTSGGGGGSNTRFTNFHSIDGGCRNSELIEKMNSEVGDHNTSSGVNGGTGTSVRHDNTKVRVPISICLIVIVSYILAGSVLFMLWEKWDLLKSSYFCFITLTTIGFGDVVPGTATESWSTSHEKLVLCALWLALGLSLLAMCFNLMQEEVKEKFKSLAKKCGLIVPDEN